jgi:hypothetical protein
VYYLCVLFWPLIFNESLEYTFSDMPH